MLARDLPQNDHTRVPISSVSKRRPRTSLLLAAGLMAGIVLSLGANAPLSRDDFLSVERILDVVRGHWLIVHDTYPEFHRQMVRDAAGFVSRKPPLFFWLCGIVVKLAGRVSEINVRLVSLVAAAAIALEVLTWTATYLDAGNAWLGFLFLLGSYGFTARATVVLPDMLLTFFIFSGFCLSYPLLEQDTIPPAVSQGGSTRAVRYRLHSRSIMAGVLLGLAVLTKGPVGLLLYAFAAAIYLLLFRCRPWAPLRRFWPWEVLIAAVLVAGWWYSAMWLELGTTALKLIQVENLGAFMPASLGGEGAGSRGLLYIDLKILTETLPLSLLAPALCLALIARVHGERERRPLCFQLSLLLSVALFFSVASMKRDDYILPALPSLAILLASLFTIRSEPAVATSGGPHRWRQPIDSLASGRWCFLSRAVALILAGAGTLLLMVGTLFVAQGAVRVGTLDFRLQPTDSWYADLFVAGMSRLSLPFLIFFVTLAIAELVLFGSLVKRYTLGMGAGLALLSLACVSLWTGTLRPELNRRRSLKQFAEETTRQTDGAEVYYFEDPPREISFYSGRHIAQLQHRRGWCSARSQPIYLILWQREAALLPRRCVERLKSVLVANNASTDRPGLFELAPGKQQP